MTNAERWEFLRLHASREHKLTLIALPWHEWNTFIDFISSQGDGEENPPHRLTIGESE